MDTILISIKPIWCNLIFKKEKFFEIRKNKPKIDLPFKCLVYETKDGGKGCGQIIGEFICDRIEKFNTPIEDDEISQNILKGSCLTQKQINDYGNSKSLFAWHITNTTIYYKTIELKENAPQSWKYFKE